jgi:multisubunit Na+/H+ antiporter MnhB subunit
MRRDAVLFIALGAALFLGAELFWIGFGHYLRGPVVAVSGFLVGAASVRLLIIGFRRARSRRQV